MKKILRNAKCLFIIPLTVMLVLFAGCEYARNEPLDPDALPDEVSFSTDIIPVFEAKCIQCHAGSQPPDLTVDYAFTDLTGGNYINTESPESSKLYEEITGSGSMAPYANDFDRALILKWIEQGAQDN